MALYSIFSHVKFVTVRSCQPVAITQADGSPPVGNPCLPFRKRALVTALKPLTAQSWHYSREDNPPWRHKGHINSVSSDTRHRNGLHTFSNSDPLNYISNRHKSDVAMLPTAQNHTTVINHFSFESFKVNKSRMRWAEHVTWMRKSGGEIWIKQTF